MMSILMKNYSDSWHLETRLENGSLLLTADRIEFDQNRSLASANGKVILTDGDFRILAKDLEISLPNRRLQCI